MSSIQHIQSVNSQRANRALVFSSFGVAMGSATIIKMQNLTHLGLIFERTKNHIHDIEYDVNILQSRKKPCSKATCKDVSDHDGRIYTTK